MLIPRVNLLVALVVASGGVTACSGDGANDGAAAVPAGACRTNGTATGSYVASCNDCGHAKCNTELADKAGSAWAQQYFGGDGACAPFNDCLCTCLASGPADPLNCATTTCIGKMDPACEKAVQAAQDCLDSQCKTECR